MSVAEPQAVDAVQAPRRILVVDDAPIFREIETVFLRRSGTVLTADDGTSALELARRERPDLVLTDLTMREMHGDELCRAMRSDPDLRNTPVIVVTSGRSPEEHERAVRAGADDIIEKPLKRVGLLQSVNRFLRARMRSQPRATLEIDVTLSVKGEVLSGRSRNVSRGGIFVEARPTYEPDTELGVVFHTPDGARRIAPTARVAWRRPERSDAAQVPGMGLQFLRLEPEAAEWLEEYVYEFATPDALANGGPG